jgi:ribonuclease P protein component
MLKQKFRLKNKKDFDNVYKKGRKAASRFFLIKVKSNQKDISRIGFVVSKKIVSKIVLRNKLKRKMREAIRLLIDKIKPGYDIIIIATTSASLKNYIEIEKDLKKLLKDRQLLKI